MKNHKISITISTVLMFAVLFGCKKDDDAMVAQFHPNGIKILTAASKTVTASTYTFGSNSEREVEYIDIADINGVNFITLASNEAIAVSVDDNFDINGDTILLADSNVNTYTGQNFSVSENGDAITLTGQVTNDNDANDTKNVTIRIEESQIGAGNTSYTVEGENATFSGTLGTYAYNQLLEINAMHPAVKTIILASIEGSVNDEINVETGRLLRDAGYGTHLKADSEIYSGGVDLFCSGKTRTREVGSKIGVHSWCCYQGQTADQLPQDSPGHNSQLAYFKEMLGNINGPSFYFFTINAASFEGIHIMTDSEITQYQLITN